MKKILLALIAACLSSQVWAADNAVTLTVGSGVTMRTIDIGSGVQSSVVILGGATGLSIYGTAGTANANVISIQGIASMTPLLANPGTATNWGVQANGSTIPANSVAQGISVAGATRPATGGAFGSTYSQHVAIVDASGAQITSFGGSNASVGTIGATAPTSATYLGYLSGSNMVAISAAAPLPVSAAGDADNTIALASLGGSAIQGIAQTSSTTCTTDRNCTLSLEPSTRNVRVVTQGAMNVTPTDCSVAITTGGTAQNILATSSTRRGFTISNLDTSEALWMNFNGTAAASTIGSHPLASATATTFQGGGSYTTPLGFGANTAVSVVAATTGHKISCTQW